MTRFRRLYLYYLRSTHWHTVRAKLIGPLGFYFYRKSTYSHQNVCRYLFHRIPELNKLSKTVWIIRHTVYYWVAFIFRRCGNRNPFIYATRIQTFGELLLLRLDTSVDYSIISRFHWKDADYKFILYICVIHCNII